MGPRKQCVRPRLDDSRTARLSAGPADLEGRDEKTRLAAIDVARGHLPSRVARGCRRAAAVAAAARRRPPFRRAGGGADAALAHARRQRQRADLPLDGHAVRDANGRPGRGCVETAAERSAARLHLSLRRHRAARRGRPRAHLYERAPHPQGRPNRHRDLPQQQRRADPFHRLVDDQVDHRDPDRRRARRRQPALARRSGDRLSAGAKGWRL